MRAYLDILKEQNTQVTIYYNNGEMENGYIKDYDEMGVVYAKGMLMSACALNPPILAPWGSIRNVKAEEEQS